MARDRHLRLAQEYLAAWENEPNAGESRATEYLALAQVHATLAVVAAIEAQGRRSTRGVQ